MPTTRLAPSPTGALHLGNARTLLINWILARQSGWRIVLRIEDLDGPRVRPGADRTVIEDLQWLGIDWDAGPVYQSGRLDRYRDAVRRLLSQGEAYPCVCSRREAQLAASAPHADDGSTPYPGTCRGRFASLEQARQQTAREPAVRFRVPDERVEFTDQFVGPCSYDVAGDLGDFVVAKADGTAAYQLAVVIDDAEMEVTHVVRGDDLLDSAPRQMLLYRALGWSGRIPAYVHVPLVVGPDGKRLAKRHGDTRLSTYRAMGVPAGRVRALLGKWCGLEEDDSCSLDRMVSEFSLSRLTRQRITMTGSDELFLRGDGAVGLLR